MSLPRCVDLTAFDGVAFPADLTGAPVGAGPAPQERDLGPTGVRRLDGVQPPAVIKKGEG